MAKEKEFTLIFDDFNVGFAPLAHLDSLTSIGKSSHASVMTNCDIISLPGKLTQGPGLSTLINGTEAGVVTELINFIQDMASASNVAYAIGATKLFKLSATTVTSGGSPSWPQAITTCTDGSSVIYLSGNLYGFYNMAGSVGDILKMPLSTETIDPDWGSTVPTGGAALQSAIHPVAAQQDLIVFGNGRYLGTYNATLNTLAPTKLDFGTDGVVADVIFHANQWWLAVNSGISGSNRTVGRIYLYDGSAISSIIADETAVGVQRIGFIYALNGVVFVAYQDLSSSGGFHIGYISGRQLKHLRSFTGSLPTFAQKSLFNNTIIFVSSGLIYSCGAVIDQLPVQISQLMDGGFTTVGAIACPFGTILTASTQSTSYKLAKASGYDTACTFKSIVAPTVSGRFLGMIDSAVVLTNVLGSGASATLILEANQAVNSSATKTIATTGKTRHVFTEFALNGIEDVRIAFNFAGGSVSNPVVIRQVILSGHWLET